MEYLLGGSGLGKSQILCCLSAAALKQGKNVVYYTLELSANEVALRHDSRLTGFPLDILSFKKDLTREKILKEVPRTINHKRISNQRRFSYDY